MSTWKGAERWLVSSCLLGATGLLVALLVVTRGRLQPRAALATGYGAASLCTGALLAITGTTDNLDVPHAIGWRGTPMGLSCCEQLTPGFPVATRPLADVWSPDWVSHTSNNSNDLGLYHAIRGHLGVSSGADGVACPLILDNRQEQESDDGRQDTPQCTRGGG